MIYILTIVPWMLTVGVLLAIIWYKSKPYEDDSNDNEYDLEDSMGTIRVAVINEKAYWVHDNVFYESEVIKEPDFDTAQPVDIDSLSPKQMQDLFEILDDLEHSNEGE